MNSSIDYLSSLSEEKREQVSQRFELIRPILLLERVKEGDLRAATQFFDKYKKYLLDGELLDELNQETLIRRIINNTNKSRATIMRHLKGYRNAENETNNNGLVWISIF